MKISIVIPTYEMKGVGVSFLKYNIERIHSQSFKDYEIIVADHSEDYAISQLCSTIPDVKYFRDSRGRGNSSANMNNGVSHATGEIIKPMFQDDFFFSPLALAQIHGHFVAGARWVVCGNNVTTDREIFSREMIPSWNDRIIFGVNTLSSPSCLAYLNCGELWDERLVWLMDCYFYNRLFMRFGKPTIESDILVTNLCHSKQLTKLLPKSVKQYEVDLMKREYGTGN
jgi:glycosyltransferase involved in cell wall biosynthesis